MLEYYKSKKNNSSYFLDKIILSEMKEPLMLFSILISIITFIPYFIIHKINFLEIDLLKLILPSFIFSIMIFCCSFIIISTIYAFFSEEKNKGKEYTIIFQGKNIKKTIFQNIKEKNFYDLNIQLTYLTIIAESIIVFSFYLYNKKQIIYVFIVINLFIYLFIKLKKKFNKKEILSKSKSVIKYDRFILASMISISFSFFLSFLYIEIEIVSSFMENPLILEENSIITGILIVFIVICLFDAYELLLFKKYYSFLVTFLIAIFMFGYAFDKTYYFLIKHTLKFFNVGNYYAEIKLDNKLYPFFANSSNLDKGFIEMNIFIIYQSDTFLYFKENENYLYSDTYKIPMKNIIYIKL